jgi:hypothetical protein
MKKIIYILIISLCPLISLAQNLEWALKVGGSYDDECRDVTHDEDGNIYLTGGFCNSVNFNPHGTPFFLNSHGVDVLDIFIAKYDPDFNLIWALSIGNNGWESGRSIKVDSSNNVYVSGHFSGNVDFDPSSGNYFLYSLELSHFLAKYNADGHFEWAKIIGNNTNSTFLLESHLFIDNNENVFSHQNDTLKSFDINGNLLWYKAISGGPILLGKTRFAYMANFTYPHIFQYYYQDTVRLSMFGVNNGNQHSYLVANTNDGFIGGYISEGHDGEILICGKFWGSVSFYGFNDTITISNYDSVMIWPGLLWPFEKEFIAKIDTLGNAIWVNTNMEPNLEPYILKTNSVGEIFTVNTGLIAKYDSSFNLLAYSIFLGGSGNDHIGGMELYDDTAIICGHFMNVIDVDLTNNFYFLSTYLYEDIFIAKYSSFDITTNPVFVKRMPNKGDKIAIYPNPSTGVYCLEFNEPNTNSVLIVYDIYGRELISQKVESNNYILDISQYKNGIYLLTIIQKNEMSSIKLVKQD